MKIVLLVYPTYEKCPEASEYSAFAEISEIRKSKANVLSVWKKRWIHLNFFSSVFRNIFVNIRENNNMIQNAYFRAEGKDNIKKKHV